MNSVKRHASAKAQPVEADAQKFGERQIFNIPERKLDRESQQTE